MRDLDETDLEILQLLMSDARRSWRDIATVVGLSPPAVSDRVDRLEELGVIQRFTVDIDRSRLREGVPVLVSLSVEPSSRETVKSALVGADAVEYVFETATDRLVCFAKITDGDVPAWLERTIDRSTVEAYDVTLLTDAEWTPTVDGTDFALSCVECGNSVTSEGVAERINGELYQFCCPSCNERFRSRYERLESSSNS